MTPQGCASASTSWRPWKKPRRSRKRPDKRGRTGGTERTGRAPAHPAQTQAPPEGSPARQVPGRTHQQDSPRRGPQMPSARAGPDRRTGRGQPTVHPRSHEGQSPPAGRPSPHDARRSRRGQGLLVPRQPLLPAQTRYQGSHPGKAGPTSNRKKKGAQGGRPVSHDADLYKERNTVERLINKLKAWRGIATRYARGPGTERRVSAGPMEGSVRPGSLSYKGLALWSRGGVPDCSMVSPALSTGSRPPPRFQRSPAGERQPVLGRVEAEPELVHHLAEPRPGPPFHGERRLHTGRCVPARSRLACGELARMVDWTGSARLPRRSAIWPSWSFSKSPA